jgi:hypothetical protein
VKKFIDNKKNYPTLVRMESMPSNPNDDDSFAENVGAMFNDIESHLREAATDDAEYDRQVMRHEETMMDKLEQRGMALAIRLRSVRDDMAPMRPLLYTVAALDEHLKAIRQLRASGAVRTLAGHSLEDVEHDFEQVQQFGSVLNMVASRKQDGDTGHYPDMQHALALKDAFTDTDYGRYADDVRGVIDELFS